jgi:hypothetical protein
MVNVPVQLRYVVYLGTVRIYIAVENCARYIHHVVPGTYLTILYLKRPMAGRPNSQLLSATVQKPLQKLLTNVLFGVF